MMEKMDIEGMMCAHCQVHVEKVLNGIDGVKVIVDLKNNCTDIELDHNVEETVSVKAVGDTGYKVVEFE